MIVSTEEFKNISIEELQNYLFVRTKILNIITHPIFLLIPTTTIVFCALATESIFRHISVPFYLFLSTTLSIFLVLTPHFLKRNFFFKNKEKFFKFILAKYNLKLLNKDYSLIGDGKKLEVLPAVIDHKQGVMYMLVEKSYVVIDPKKDIKSIMTRQSSYYKDYILIFKYDKEGVGQIEKEFIYKIDINLLTDIAKLDDFFKVV